MTDDSHPNITGIILAAGASRRMGQAKSLLILDKQTVLAHHVSALSLVAQSIIVVVGANHAPVVAELADIDASVTVLYNPDWDSTTQIDTLRIALRSIPPDTIAIITPVDATPAAPDTLVQLIHHASSSAVPISPDGQRGHPVKLSPVLQKRVLTTPAPDGLRPFLESVDTVTVVDPLVHWDFDTPESWAEFVSRWTNDRQGINTGRAAR